MDFLPNFQQASSLINNMFIVLLYLTLVSIPYLDWNIVNFIQRFQCMDLFILIMPL